MPDEIFDKLVYPLFYNRGGINHFEWWQTQIFRDKLAEILRLGEPPAEIIEKGSVTLEDAVSKWLEVRDLPNTETSRPTSLYPR